VNFTTGLFWTAAVCCVVAELVLLRSLLFGRARAAEQEHARDVHMSRPVQIAWALIPAAGLLLVLYLTWRAVDRTQDPPVNFGHSGVTIGASR
jgi:heme/copper-type cytochrome/quinol oxidase subunit 2